ncbi:glycoside hydrolase family 30 protein [Nonlabens xiamenensis]|uniref:glycoside hydrolase family 30 protein n=1 Tax=Nonlabens xiamenensis TaxID=2341043 RepID=UPI000F612ECB|nr:glycoside hydrolase family 30 beta sandwich domain-containing protein [Nonlabens xiamenensis]
MNVLNQILIFGLLGLGVLQACQEDELPNYSPPEAAEVGVDFYLTTPDQSNLVSLQENMVFPLTENNNFTIAVNENEVYQSMDGFGFCLTGGSALVINGMSSSARSGLLNEVFGSQEGELASSYLRISIGASDLDTSVFTYNDLSSGQTDPNLTQFSIDPDRANLIPVLKEILMIQPELKILATPWTAPSWMKTNGSSIGGELQPQYYDTYAQYFVRYIQAMQAEGIRIDAITVQNEPENPFNNPSMLMTAAQQVDFVGNHLGPAFAGAGIDTKIIAFDHNPDNTGYPIAVLNDPTANSYIDGSAFHLYAGQIDNLSLVHNAHPDKNIYFTEQWVQAPGNFEEDIRWHFRELVIGATRNWSKTVLEWNLAANPNNGPFTPGGCTECLGAVTIDGNNVSRNPAYYIIAQASRFIPPGSQRIASNDVNDLPNVAFKTPEGKVVVIVLNNSDSQRTFNINSSQEPITTSLPAGAAGTFVWQ